MKSSIQSRCLGLLLGLCAGDRNGGPQRMAMRVAESLQESAAVTSTASAKPTFYRESVIRRYYSWYNPQKENNEPDVAFDTGVVFDTVFAFVARSVAKNTTSNDATSVLIDEAAALMYKDRKSAGVSPAHRNTVLAMAPFLSDSELVDAAKSETTITHLHPESIDTSIAAVLICRRLIEGKSLQDAVDAAKPYVKDPLVVKALDRFPYRGAHPLDQGGRSPLVLEAALYFVAHAASFTEALVASMDFAGGANYCPVLVGSIGGAYWGVSDSSLKEIVSSCSSCGKNEDDALKEVKKENDDIGVTLTTLTHNMCQLPHRQRILHVATGLAQLWREPQEKL